MGRAPCCDKVGLKKGPWTSEEDQILVSFIQQHGHSNWRALPKQAGLLRCGKSCRLRWMNYLRPGIKRGNFSKEEEDTIIHLHGIMGNRWSAIAARLPGRTDNEIKNVWHTHLKKKVKQHQTIKPEPEMAAGTHKNLIGHANNNYVTTMSNETTSAGTSHQYVSTSPQQSYGTSDDFSSFNEVSSTQVPNNIISVKKDQILDTHHSDMDYFPILDETFWSYDQDFHYDGGHDMTSVFSSTGDGNQWQDQFLKDNTSKACNVFSSTYNGTGLENNEDNMDLWYDIFLKAGSAPELPEF